jgi:hypothetical protein
MSEDLESDVLIRMAMVAVQGMPSDWVAAGPILGAVLELADLPICAAPHPDASRALEALGARLPVARNPEERPPLSIGLLVLGDPSEFTPDWVPALAPGAILLTRNAPGPVFEGEGAVNALLDFEAGISLDLCAGGDNPDLRALIEACGRRPALAAAIVRMAAVLQGKHAHLDLAQRAVPRSDAASAEAEGGVVAPPVDPPDADPGGTGGNAKAARRPTPWYVRLKRRIGLGRKPR